MRLVLDDRIVLGEGTHSTVYHGTLDHESIAAKRTNYEAELRQEAAFLSRCNHPNVVRMKGLVMLQEQYYLVMELARGGNLRENLGQRRFSRAQKLSLVQQICFGLEHIHSLKILHRNISAENLLLKDGHHLVIADFGMALEYQGRPIFRNDDDIVRDAVYTFKSDVFLVALVVFQIFEDRRNVNRSTLAREIEEQWTAGGLNRAIFDVGRWEETLMNALHWRIERRPSVAEFRQAFLDPANR